MKRKKTKKTNPRRQVATQADINKAKAEMTRELCLVVVCFSAMALRDTYDFGPARIEKFITNLMQKFNDWDEGLFSVDDAKAWFEEYTKMTLLQEVDNDSKRAVE